MTSAQAHKAIFDYLTAHDSGDPNEALLGEDIGMLVANDLLELLFTPIYQEAFDKGYDQGKLETPGPGDLDYQPDASFLDGQTSLGADVAHDLLQKG